MSGEKLTRVTSESQLFVGALVEELGCENGHSRHQHLIVADGGITDFWCDECEEIDRYECRGWMLAGDDCGDPTLSTCFYHTIQQGLLFLVDVGLSQETDTARTRKLEGVR